MKNFEYASPTTEAELLEHLRDWPGETELLAGGTDLVGLMQKMVITPKRVVNLLEVPSFRDVEELDGGVISIGATVTLDTLMVHPYLNPYPALRHATEGIASLQIQCQGTLGGEVLQRPQCWFFRDNRGLLAAGGKLAEQGDNRYHAIFGNQGAAKFVSASRLAPALLTLGAMARVIGPEESNEQIVPLDRLFCIPRHEGERENTLAPGQVMTHILLPPADGVANATYEVRHGEGPDYPLAAAAAALRMDGGIVRDAKIVLGHVAPMPWPSLATAARIAKSTGRPVKFMLDRDQELKIAGARPSGYLKVRLGADKDGMITVWDSEHWGTAGATGGSVSQTVIPYVLAPKNYRRSAVNIKTNNGPSRAWRAPNHPQACAITQTALDDLAMKMGANSLDIFIKNLGTDDKPLVAGAKPSVYKAEMERAAELIGWKEKWHPHGKGQRRGSIVDGLGLAFHTWGGGAGQSSCTVKIHPNGDVETTCGTQDLGSGTRTVVALILAETFGLPYESIRLNIGSSKYPISGASGGSTTVGGVSESHRRAAQDAFAKIAELVGKDLGVDPSTLEAVDGKVQVKGDSSKSKTWKQACSLLGMSPLEVKGEYARGTRSPLSSSQVGGVQMAHVEVDRETGVVKLKKFVAVQDMGIIISPTQAESQIYGAVIMGIAAALFEQRINDPATGAFVNADLANYKLARLGDIGEIVVDFYEPESERQRGVIGLGEPPAISPKAAISNAVCNALGVRVSPIPLTPQRVLEALKKAERNA